MSPEGTTQCPVRGRHGGHRKKKGMHAVAIGGIEDHAHAPHRYRTNSRHCEGRAGVEGKFLAMDEQPSGDRIWMARRIFRVQRQPVPSASQKEHHQKIDSAIEFELLLKKHEFELRD